MWTAVGWFVWVVLFALVVRVTGVWARGVESAPEPYWPGRPLRFSMEPLDRFCLLVILGIAVTSFLARGTMYPWPPDSYYHLPLARSIVERGAVPLWDTWQHAPLGRPQLYPPFFHILIALCSLPFRGDVVEGFRVVQALMLPMALVSTWYAARWLFDARRAFFAMLILGADLSFGMLSFMCVPSILANVLVVLVLVAFLSKRVVPAALLLSLGFYTHMGVMSFAALGLVVFALWRREYLGTALAVAIPTAALIAPWYAHVWFYRDWMTDAVGSGLVAGRSFPVRVVLRMTWLLSVNVVMFVLVFRGFRITRWRETRERLLLCNVIGFLPMLSYGGRFFVHTTPIWAMLGSIALVGFLPQRVRYRRAALVLLAALVFPNLLIVGIGSPLTPGPMPAPSGWILPVTTAAGGGEVIDSNSARLGSVSVREAMDLGAEIDATTSPEQIVHALDDGVATMVGFYARRRTSGAVWTEINPGPQTLENMRKAARHDPDGLYIVTDPEERGSFPSDIEWRAFGRFYVGQRF